MKNVDFQFTLLSRFEYKFIVFPKIWILKEINFILAWFPCGMNRLVFEIVNSPNFLKQDYWLQKRIKYFLWNV